jgi:hypothetical protein
MDGFFAAMEEWQAMQVATEGKPHGVTGVGVDVTSLALQLETAGVELVTVGKRLFGRWLRRG